MFQLSLKKEWQAHKCLYSVIKDNKQKESQSQIISAPKEVTFYKTVLHRQFLCGKYLYYITFLLKFDWNLRIYKKVSYEISCFWDIQYFLFLLLTDFVTTFPIL